VDIYYFTQPCAVGNFRGTFSFLKILKGYMVRKVGNLCNRLMQTHTRIGYG